VPPASVPELDDVAPRGVELAHNVVEPCPGEAISRRELKQKTAHAVAEDIGDHSKILNKVFCALELLHMRDELTDFDGVDQFPFARLPPPGLNVGNGRPGVKGCVNLDGVEALRVMLEPVR